MTNPNKFRQKKGAKALRDQAVIAKALSGKSGQTIAKEVGISRQTVSQILNSEEMKARISEIDLKLANGIDDAIATVLLAVKTDIHAAIKLLQNFGTFKNRLELDGRLSLEQLVLGSMQTIEED